MLWLWVGMSGCVSPGVGGAQTRHAELAVNELRVRIDNERVDVTLRNGTRGLVGVNLCELRVEVKRGRQWAPMEDPWDSDCVDERRDLSPGEELSTALWSRYWSSHPMRLKLDVEVSMGSAAEEILSEDFRANYSGDTAGEGDFDDFGRPINEQGS
jgi:hypothetical protein